jgi:nucleoside-diphosphate-sugar epimerase
MPESRSPLSVDPPTATDSRPPISAGLQTAKRGVTLRLGLLYGPGLGSTKDIITYARMGVEVLPGPPDAYCPMLWIDDAASALVAALERAPSGVYDIADDEPLPRTEMFAAMARSVGRRGLLRLPGSWIRLMGGPGMTPIARSQRVSNQRFKEATGWAPVVHDARVGWERLGGAGHAGHSGHTEGSASADNATRVGSAR